MAIYAPQTIEELAQIIATAKTGLRPFGGDSRHAIGRANEAGLDGLNLSAFSGIKDYSPSELTLTAGAATPLGLIEKTLQKNGQRLAFDPPNWQGIFNPPYLNKQQEGHKDHGGQPTLAGAILTGFSGPNRLGGGAVRDHILGVSGVTGRGESFKAGAAVVKNVTGYDLPKLMVGSFGTLAALHEIIVKVLPAPPQSYTLAMTVDSVTIAQQVFTAMLAGPYEITAASLLPQHLLAHAVGRAQSKLAFEKLAAGKFILLTRFEGRDEGPLSRLEQAKSMVKDHFQIGAMALIEGNQNGNLLWGAIRDLTLLTPENEEQEIWRLSLPPAKFSSLAMDFPTMRIKDWFADWGGAQIFLRTPVLKPDNDHNNSADGHHDWGKDFFPLLQGFGGHATRIIAPLAVRANAQIFQPLPGPLHGLNQKLKQAFDPNLRLNPHKIWPEG